MMPFLAALVLLHAPCGLILPDGTTTPTTGHVTITSFDRRGNGIVVCHGVIDPPPARVELDYASTGVWCGAGKGATQDWHEVITADGRATLVCRIVGQ